MRLVKRVINKLKNTTPEEVENKSLIHAFFIDSPQSVHISTKKLHIEGWIIPTQGHIITGVEAINNGTILKLHYGKERLDVAEVYKEIIHSSTNYGFYGEIPYEDGDLSIVVKFDNEKSEEILNSQIIYSPEELVDMIKNANLAEYVADHTNLLRAKKDYYYEVNNPHQYIQGKDDVKSIAFYLPQFHPIPENDKTWGSGFTEWTNVTRAVPRFVGHQQPILPEGLGFYDLRVEETIKQQIDLAKAHGIYGFCFYYYWFSGKKILDAPLNTLLKRRDWDFNFCICWANENWTKRWDGREKEVIVSQSYLKTDPLNFIKDVAPILNDERYITQDGKPVLVIYRASELKNPEEYVQIWRDYFRKTFSKELYLVASMGFETQDPTLFGFDIGLDFAPQTNFFKEGVFADKHFPYINTRLHYLDKNFNGSVTPYGATALNKGINNFFDFPVIDSVTPSWDNDARRNGTGFVMHGSNPDLYGTWLERAVSRAKKSEVPLVFINAWNEWAEGAILEPSQHLGYANLNRTSEILARYSDDSENKKKFPLYGKTESIRRNRFALVVHIDSKFNANYFRKEIIEKLVALPVDIYITTIKKFEEDARIFIKDLPIKVRLKVVPDRGRDLWPFLFTLSRFTCTYQYVLKLHIGNDVDQERTYIESLVGDEELRNIQSNQPVGTSFSSEQHGNTTTRDSFWVNEKAIEAIVSKGYVIEDFGPELSGQEQDDVRKIRSDIADIISRENS